jgi:exodeoxyribonuclease VII large subunit
MPDTHSSNSLSSILTRIRKIIEEKTAHKEFWLRAEISQLLIHSSGHCYLDLVETKDDKIIAQAKAIIWKNEVAEIRYKLGTDFGNILKKGNVILCLAIVTFHEVYGLRIRLQKIDVSFNLGEMERRRQETVSRLTSEGIIAANKTKKLPSVIQKIALIASTTTAGYADFCKQLKQNTYGYVFEVIDYVTSVQGESAVTEICTKLECLMQSKFDAIAIIRGGGSKLDLDVFNDYKLARAIALHNLPVLTGIGHETDFSVADIVACMHHKTPTALGAFIVESAHTYEQSITDCFSAIIQLKNHFFEREYGKLTLGAQVIRSTGLKTSQLRRGELHTQITRINVCAIAALNSEKNRLAVSKEIIKTQPSVSIRHAAQTISHTLGLISAGFSGRVRQGVEANIFTLRMVATYAKNICDAETSFVTNAMKLSEARDPKKVLRQGYAIPRVGGVLLSNQQLHKGDIIEMELASRMLLASFLQWR